MIRLGSIFLLFSSFLLLNLSFNNGKIMSLTANKTDTYEILFTFLRNERSKDSNSSEIKIGLAQDTIYYFEKHWGFKANSKIIDKRKKVSNQFVDSIINFIDNSFQKKDYTESIRINGKRNFTIFSYQLLIKNKKANYQIRIDTNDQTITDNNYYNSLNELFDKLQSEIE